MNGSQYPPIRRSPGDFSQSAFNIAPNQSHTGHIGSGPPGEPHPRQDYRRQLPLVSHLELGPLAGAVPSARRHARLVMQEWGLGDEVTTTAELLVSELTTNALAASRALRQPLPSPIHLWLKGGFRRVFITVWDGDPQPPVLREVVSPDAENGRGLLLVDHFSERWGWFEPALFGGKCVWCEVVHQSAGK
jgi:anti-sigma regulatory factor (Ser/Thr protein kinase)